jgi:hypothetical protein
MISSWTATATPATFRCWTMHFVCAYDYHRNQGTHCNSGDIVGVLLFLLNGIRYCRRDDYDQVIFTLAEELFYRDVKAPARSEP